MNKSIRIIENIVRRKLMEANGDVDWRLVAVQIDKAIDNIVADSGIDDESVVVQAILDYLNRKYANRYRSSGTHNL